MDRFLYFHLIFDALLVFFVVYRFYKKSKAKNHTDSDKYINKLLDMVDEPVVIHRKGKIIAANKKATKTLGYKRIHSKGDKASFLQLRQKLKSNTLNNLFCNKNLDNEIALDTNYDNKTNISPSKSVDIKNELLKLSSEISSEKNKIGILGKDFLTSIKNNPLCCAEEEFLCNMDHELRTPLTTVMSTLQLLKFYINKNKSLSENDFVAKKMNTMQAGCFRMLRTIENLIDLTKLNTGNYSLAFNDYDIEETVSNVVSSATPLINRKGIQVFFSSSLKKRIILIDQYSIERVILNLLSNATKFTKTGGTIEVEMYDKKKYVYVSVRDSGSGISKENQKKVFKRFARMDCSLTRGSEGSGMGLHIVNALVKMHGGKIKLKSIKGAGSEFTVRIPLYRKGVQKINTAPNTKESFIDRVNMEFSDIYH